MGKPIARNLLAKGNHLVLFNRSSAAVEGARRRRERQRRDSPAAVARRCDIVFLMLPDGPDVQSILAGERGILRSAKPEAIIVDMSSIAPAGIAADERSATISSARYRCAGQRRRSTEQSQGRFQSCAAARNTTSKPSSRCSCRWGRAPNRRCRIRPGRQACEPGFGRASPAGDGRSVLVRRALGIDGATVFTAIKEGLAGSNVLNAKVPKILTDDYAPGFKVRLHLKDLNNALAAASEVGADLASARSVRDELQRLTDSGRGELDHGSIPSPGCPMTAAPVGSLPSETGHAVIQWTSSSSTDQHLYFTSPTVTSDNRWLVFISDRCGGHPNLFAIDRGSGVIRTLTNNRHGLMRNYVYPSGGERLIKASPCLNSATGELFYVRDGAAYAIALDDGTDRHLCDLPQDWWLAYNDIAPDGSVVCVPCAHPDAFPPNLQTQWEQLRLVPQRMIERGLITQLLQLDLRTGATPSWRRYPSGRRTCSTIPLVRAGLFSIAKATTLMAGRESGGSNPAAIPAALRTAG